VERFRQALNHPLAIVAAGGTETAAYLWARLHEAGGYPAWVTHPQDFIARPIPRDAIALILSTSGRHHDLLGAARHALNSGTPTHVVVTAERSPLVALARDAGAENASLTLPSLTPEEARYDLHCTVPMSVLACHLYEGGGPWAECFEGGPFPLPDGLPDDVVTLGAGLARTVAVDFAQKCRESGLAPAHVSELRQFAHGGVMAVRPGKTWLVPCALGDQGAYLDRYLAQVPDDVSVLRLDDPREGVKAALNLLARSMMTFVRLADRAGQYPNRSRFPRWASQLRLLPLDS
jgi:fructoselysine-6-P-deglycase FrlB-like protein